jgi:hypothetical protein
MLVFFFIDHSNQTFFISKEPGIKASLESFINFAFVIISLEGEEAVVGFELRARQALNHLSDVLLYFGGGVSLLCPDQPALDFNPLLFIPAT